MSIANVNALKPAPFVRIKRFHYHDQFIEAPSGRSDPFYYGDLQGHGNSTWHISREEVKPVIHSVNRFFVASWRKKIVKMNYFFCIEKQRIFLEFGQKEIFESNALAH